MSKVSNLSPVIIAKLKENTTGTNGTHYFDLSSMYIGPREIAVIGDCIRLNGISIDGMAPILTLDLSNNLLCGLNTWGKGNYDADGFQEFFNSLHAIHKVNRLRKLILSRNYLDLRGFTILGNYLSNCPITLMELHLRSCCGTGDAIEKCIDSMKINKSLQILDIRENPLGIKGGLLLGELIYASNRLKQVMISSCNLQSEGAGAIFTALQNNVSIEILCMNDNFIGDIGSEILGNTLKINHKIKHLDIQDNGIGLDGITYIAKGLAKNRGLVYLGLCYNNLCNESAHILGEQLALNTSLKGIHIVGNPMNIDGIKAIIHGSALGNEKPVDLDLAYCYKFQGKGKVREKKVLKELTPEDEEAANGEVGNTK